MQVCSPGIPLKPIVEQGRVGGRRQPRKQGNSMEEITQDVAIQTKMQMQCNFLKSHMKRHTEDADACILGLWLKTGCDAWLLFLIEADWWRWWVLCALAPPLQMPHPVVLVIWIQQHFKMNTFTFYVVVSHFTCHHYSLKMNILFQCYVITIDMMCIWKIKLYSY